MHAVVGPFLVGAKIRDRGLDLDDPDFAIASERHQIGTPPRQQRQLRHAGQPQRQQQSLGAARNRERRLRLAPVGGNDGDGAERHGAGFHGAPQRTSVLTARPGEKEGYLVDHQGRREA